MLEDEFNELFYYAAEGSTTELERHVKLGRDALLLRDYRGRKQHFFFGSAFVHAALTDNLKNAQFLMKKGLPWWQTDNGGATALHWATQAGATKVIRLILQNLKTPSGVAGYLVGDKDGVTPLHIAARRHSAKILKMFVDCISPADDVHRHAQDANGRSPLHYAAIAASVECCQLIIDSDVLGLPVDQKDRQGVTPLMCAVGVNLPQAVEVVRLLGARKTMSIGARTHYCQSSSLHLAVAADNLPVLAVLLTEFNTMVDVYDKENRTPLHYAADAGNAPAVKMLLAAGASAMKRDIYDVTPAHYAAQRDVATLTQLLKRRDPTNTALPSPLTPDGHPPKSMIQEVRDSHGRTCLMWAVVAGNMQTIEYLLGAAAPERQDQDQRGFTALHLAAMMGHEKICRILVKQGWNLNERDNNFMTPLHLAAGRGHTDVVRLLVTNGANMNEKCAMKRTAVYSACFGGQAHTLYVMCKELGFEWRTGRVPVTDAMGRTPLHAATFAGYTACIKILLEIEEEDDVLESPLVGWRDNDGETALHVACARGRLDCVLALLKGGAAVNAYDCQGDTPLQIARQKGNENIVSYLRSQDALFTEELRGKAATVIAHWWKWNKFWRAMRAKARARRAGDN